MHDFLYMEADGKCRWQLNEEKEDMSQHDADSAEEDAAENLMSDEEQKMEEEEEKEE